MTPRQFQREMEAYLNEILSGSDPKTIIAEVTPGGGKSILPIMLANALIPSGRADFLAWFVPRLTLAGQAEGDFTDPGLIAFNSHRLKIRQSTNDYRPWRDVHGFVSTHQALAIDSSETVLQAFDSARGILVIDECHHIYEGSPAHKRLIPIFNRASIRVLLSGNLTRGDGRKPAFVPCRNVTDRVLAIDYDDPGSKFIRYDRETALKEKAKIPIDFFHLDGAVSWYDRDGEYCEADTLRKPVVDGEREVPRDGSDESSPVFAALQTNYAIELLTKCIESFLAHKRFVNPTARMLIVAFNRAEAFRYLNFIKENYPELKGGIAVSKDSDDRDSSTEALRHIERFKGKAKPPIEVLVSVQMAYEGMDVKPITHIACLTHIRSWPWIEQMLDRGTRFNPAAGPWETQRLYAFVPDDDKMNEAIRKIRAGQGDYIQSPDGSETPRGAGTGNGEPPPLDNLTPDRIIPIDGQVTHLRCSGDYAGTHVTIDPDESRMLAELMNRHSLCGSPLELKALLEDLKNPQAISLPPSPAFQLGAPAPSEEEEKLRKAIDTYCRQADRAYHGMDWSKANRIVKAEFGKSRDEMTIAELKQVWGFIQKRFPLKQEAV